MGIKLFGKNILQVYTHHIMQIDYKTVLSRTEDKPSLTLRKIDLKNIDREIRPVGTTVSVENLKRLVRKNENRCEGFVLTEMGGYSVGTIWVQYKGSNDLGYRIRNIDAYIFDVYVNEKHRGKGYAGMMVRHLMCYLHEEMGINSAELAVALSNESAIRAYEKTGFTIVRDCKFARIMKVNVPYHEL